MKLLTKFSFSSIIQKDFIEGILGKAFNPITYEQAVLNVTELAKNKYDIVIRVPLRRVRDEVLNHSFYKKLWETVALYNHLAYKYLSNIDTVINRYLRFKVSLLKQLKTETGILEARINTLRKSLANKIINAKLIHIPMDQNEQYSVNFSVKDNKATVSGSRLSYEREKYIQKIIVDRFKTINIDITKYSKTPEEDYSAFGTYSLLSTGTGYGTWYEEAATDSSLPFGYPFTITIYFHNNLPINYIEAVPITVAGVKLCEVQLYKNSGWEYALKDTTALSENTWEGILSREKISCYLSHLETESSIVPQECSAIKLKFIQYHNFTDEVKSPIKIKIPTSASELQALKSVVSEKTKIKYIYPIGLFSLEVGYEVPINGISIYRTHNKDTGEGLAPEKSSYRQINVIPTVSASPDTVNIIVSKTNDQTQTITLKDVGADGNKTGVYSHSFIEDGKIPKKTKYNKQNIILDDNVAILPIAPYEDKENWWDSTLTTWKYINSTNQTPVDEDTTSVLIENTNGFVYNSSEQYWTMVIPGAKTNTTYVLELSVANHEQFDYLLGSFSIQEINGNITTGIAPAQDIRLETTDYISYSITTTTVTDITGTLNINIKAVTKESV